MPRKMQIEEVLRYVAIPLFGLGVVGAVGPRFMGFALGRASPEKTNLYWFTASPFEQYAHSIRQYKFSADAVTADELYAVHTIEKDIISFLEDLKKNDKGYATPTFIVTDFDPKLDDNFHKSIALVSEIVNHSTGGRHTLDKLRKFPMRAIDRMSFELNSATDKEVRQTARASELGFKDVLELTMTIVQPEHITAELKGMMVSWTGIIKHQIDTGNFYNINKAMSWRQVLPLLSIFPKLAKISKSSPL